MGYQRVVALTTELSSEVVHVQRPHGSATELSAVKEGHLSTNQRAESQSHRWRRLVQGPQRRSYFGIVTPLVIKTDPLVAFGCIDHVLTTDPVDRCSLQEGAGLEKKETLLTKAKKYKQWTQERFCKLSGHSAHSTTTSWKEKRVG